MSFGGQASDTARSGGFDNRSALSSSTTSIVPALGELWSHSVTNRILLYWGSISSVEPVGSSSNSNSSSSSAGVVLVPERIAEVVKSPCWPLARARFVVCDNGVRDVRPSNQVRICINMLYNLYYHHFSFCHHDS